MFLPVSGRNHTPTLAWVRGAIDDCEDEQGDDMLDNVEEDDDDGAAEAAALTTTHVAVDT